jgi:hypothetical protein
MFIIIMSLFFYAYHRGGAVRISPEGTSMGVTFLFPAKSSSCIVIVAKVLAS